MPVLAALESAPVDVEGVNRRVVERAALGEKEDVFEAHQQRERLVDRHKADRPAQRGKRDEAYLGQHAGAIDRGSVEQVLRDAAYRGGEDDHPHRCTDEAVGNDDECDRRLDHQIKRFAELEHLHQDLVQQPQFGRIDGPQPQQNVENRRAHARQEPYPAEEAASYLVDRRGGEREYEAEGHVKDGERAENVDERQADDLRQPAIALKDLRILLRREFRDAERAAEVGERHRNIDENGNDEKKTVRTIAGPRKIAKLARRRAADPAWPPRSIISSFVAAMV